MMSIRVVNAGDGYAYLLRSVATADADTSTKTKLGDYYQETGTPPGRWWGRGLSGLDSSVVVDGATVAQEHMAALYGEGLHPEADAKIAAGSSIADVQLGRAYPVYSGGDEVLAKIAAVEKEFRYHAGRRPGDDECNVLAVDVARPFYEEATGFSAARPKEILAWVNEKKNSVRQATAGFDLTFSPSKSISVLWALGDENTRRAIEDIHSRCVNDALSWLDEAAVRTHCEVAGVKKLTRTRGMMVAQFVHYDTRSGDPDLHTHCLVSNKVQGPDGVWRSIEGRSLMASAVTASTHYNTLMAQRLSEELGLAFVNYESDPTKLPVWEVAGVDPAMVEHFSKRRLGAKPRFEQLRRDYYRAHGRHPGVRASRKLWQQAVLDTRPGKDTAKSLAALRQGWQAEAREVFGNQVVDSLPERTARGRDARASAPVLGSDEWADFVAQRSAAALALAVSRRSEFRRHHLHTAVEQDLAAFSFPSLDTRLAATEQVLQRALDDAVRLTPQASYRIPGRLLGEDGEVFDRSADQVVYTTTGVLAAETTVLDSAVEPTATLLTNADVDQALVRHEREKGFALNTGQEAFARHLLCAGMHTVAGVGPAGTGKTASMAVVADAWRGSGRQVFACAPSAVAAKTLGADIGEAGHTLASLTYRWRGKIGTAPEDLTAIETMLGRQIKPGDMLLVDEAGMAATDDLAAMVEIARAAGAVVRMVGDPYQLDAVETGGLFRTVCKRTAAVELDQVMRQGDDMAQAEAGLKIRRGDSSGLDEYVERGWVVGGSRDEMVTGATKAWLADFDRGRKTLLVASTNQVVTEANRRIQHALIERGTVRASSSWWARLMRRRVPQTRLGDGLVAFVGDTILTRRNETIDQADGTAHRVLNGQKWTIDHIDRDGEITATNTETGRSITLGAHYVGQHCQLGYASTIHRAQGVTVDTTHAIVDSTTDRRGLYVALTRGRDENRVWAITDVAVDEGEEQAHLHMDGDATAPDARDVLDRIVRRDSGHVTATDIAERLAGEENTPQRADYLYRTAVAALADDYAAVALDDIVDYLPVDAAESIDQDGAMRLRAAARRGVLRGVDARSVLDEVCRIDGTERDVAAVIASRIDRLDSDQADTAGPAIPPITPMTDMQLHAFAVELQSARAPESVTVTNESVRSQSNGQPEQTSAAPSREQLREMFRARVGAATAEAVADKAVRRATHTDGTTDPLETTPGVYEPTRDLDLDL